MYLIGLDIGSSSIKAALVDGASLKVIATAQSPSSEMAIAAPHPGWAEQDPALWWQHVGLAVQSILTTASIQVRDIAAIGIAYQMHGLVALDAQGEPVRPAIIWCDSRAVAQGNRAFSDLGEQFCLKHYLNSPGNFTASKLAWVKENEPETYQRIRKIMLPGDYIAYRLTGEATTTLSGLSEGILWDFIQDGIAADLIKYFGFPADLLADQVPVFGRQGVLTRKAALELGLKAGIPVTYRAGDQPNNALSLNVLAPGELAATGGTSGVVYGVVDQLISEPMCRVNSFAHVNHTKEQPRIGVLLCINGAGSQYRWLRQQIAPEGTGYEEMERQAARIPAGADGLAILPFGNGAERIFNNHSPGAQICNLDLNRHSRPHLYRAGLEGIAFSFVYGVGVLRELGLMAKVIRAGNDNLFQSGIFAQTIADLLDCRIEILQTTGAVGSAIGAGYGAGLFESLEEGLAHLKILRVVEPERRRRPDEAYAQWMECLKKAL